MKATEIVPKSASPSIAWISPHKAIEQFADKTLVNAALGALQQHKELREKRDEEYKKKKYDPFAGVFNSLSTEVQNAEFAYWRARQSVLDNLIGQLKQGVLVGRALPFDDKKLEASQDWEIIKSSHWSVLEFDSSDSSLETIRGGGRTYKGLQVGKPT